MARESDGVIEDIDMEHATIRLSDGEIYEVPSDFDFGAVAPGMQVVVIYDDTRENRSLRAI
ncbi:DUF1344 domain-containing protein [Jiella sp. M17.18]|uniref:DUF1344 domain-containing protein n=1 Tax=Jiella sp. M17.18 TaxID=3234247 RepID=UPI0034DEC79E